MMLRQLISALLIGSVVGDLVCKDYIPHNWTTPRARLNAYDDASYDPPRPALPANITASIPLRIGNKNAPGDVYHLKTCNSSSLDLQSSYELGCDIPSRKRNLGLNRRQQGTGCEGYYLDYIQIIHPSTGHCLTAQHWWATNTNLTWAPCDPNPKNTSQFYYAGRTVYYKETRDYEPGRVYDWAPYIGLAPTPNPTESSNNGYFYLDPKDNKTVGYSTQWPGQYLGINALHYDPLTTYSKTKG